MNFISDFQREFWIETTIAMYPYQQKPKTTKNQPILNDAQLLEFIKATPPTKSVVGGARTIKSDCMIFHYTKRPRSRAKRALGSEVYKSLESIVYACILPGQYDLRINRFGFWGNKLWAY